MSVFLPPNFIKQRIDTRSTCANKKYFRLKGTLNDVQDTKSVLEEFGFEITCLQGEEATQAAILREMQRIYDKSQPV